MKEPHSIWCKCKKCGPDKIPSPGTLVSCFACGEKEVPVDGRQWCDECVLKHQRKERRPK
jgi:hypothetical protein